MPFEKLADLLSLVRQEKGGITEEDLDNATQFLMSDLGGPKEFNFFQFENWYNTYYESEVMAEQGITL